MVAVAILIAISLLIAHNFLIVHALWFDWNEIFVLINLEASRDVT